MPNEPIHRRWLMKGVAAVAAGACVSSASAREADRAASEPGETSPVGRRMKLGLVTYDIAKDWDIPTIIDACKKVGLAAVELRTSHKHGVEPSLAKTQRDEVRKRFADSGVVLCGLGSVCEFHSPDPVELARNIELAKQFVQLAHDVGAQGVKVRPNGLPKGVSEEKTIEQIGHSLRTCGEAAASLGVEIWLEVHGSQTAHPPRVRKMMDIADHPSVGVTWNSNYPADLQEGSVKPYFRLLVDKIRSVHINELTSPYPWRELFSLLNQARYERYTLIEVQALRANRIDDALRFLQYYRALWDALSRPGAWNLDSRLRGNDGRDALSRPA